MELRQLRYFLAVADFGSLSKAATQVFVAQSALSKQVADLEHELSVQLLFRSRTGVTLTEAGKTFYAYAQAILKQVEDAKSAVHSTPHSITGSVVLELPQSVSNALALPLLRAIRERLPKVSLHLNEELSGNLLGHLRQGHSDLGVYMKPEGDDLIFVPIVEEDFYLISSLEGASPVSEPPPEVELANVGLIPLIMPSTKHGILTTAVLTEALNEIDLPLKIAAEINSAQILKTAVEANIAPTVMPYPLAAQEIEMGRLRAQYIRSPAVTRVLGVCYASNIPLTHAKRAVLELVKEVSKSICEQGLWQGARALNSQRPPV